MISLTFLLTELYLWPHSQEWNSCGTTNFKIGERVMHPKKGEQGMGGRQWPERLACYWDNRRTCGSKGQGETDFSELPCWKKSVRLSGTSLVVYRLRVQGSTAGSMVLIYTVWTKRKKKWDFKHCKNECRKA